MSLAGLARGASLNLLARAATVALGLALMVHVARLGPAVQGAFALFVAVESVLLTLGSGFGLALARRISHHQEAPGRSLRRWLMVAVAFGAVAALVLLALAAAIERAPYDRLGLLALAAPLLLLVPTASGLWLGQGRMAPLNAPQVAAPALVLAALLLLPLLRPAGEGADLLGPVLVAWVAAKVLVGLATATAALRQAPAEAGPPRGGLKRDARFVIEIGLTNVVSLLNYRVTLFLVERQEGLAAAGVYSVAVQVAELLWLLSSALTVSAYHRIGQPDTDAAARTALQAARLNVGLAALAAPLLWGAAALALPRVLGEAYAGALMPLAALLPGIVAYAAASSLSAFFTNHLGRPHLSGLIAALSLALNTLGCLLVVPRFGAVGAAASTSAAYLGAIGVALWLFRRAAAGGARQGVAPLRQ
ncbi:oligosaccharide flippase family protein [Azohydromonas aeria]|uniref:oligosaccharide flippase family protein n=1 Tax=Azohydromonas aeria TaxID=2590212 RepID=UPI0012FCD37B|nr:oligosaccharide flippase family protein [Azohydromonas aeria]